MFQSKNKEYVMKGALTRYEYINFMGEVSATLFLKDAYAQSILTEEQAKSLLQDSLCFQFWLTTSYINYILMQKYRYSQDYFIEVAATAAKHYSSYYRKATSCTEKTAKTITILMRHIANTAR